MSHVVIVVNNEIWFDDATCDDLVMTTEERRVGEPNREGSLRFTCKYLAPTAAVDDLLGVFENKENDE